MRDELELLEALPVWHFWCKSLKRIRGFCANEGKEKHFTFFGLKRNGRRYADQTIALSSGVHGIRDRELAKVYYDALEKAHRYFVAQGWQAPAGYREWGVPVYLFAVDDPERECGSSQMDEITYATPGGKAEVASVLVLQSRFPDTAPDAIPAKARATAVHEAFHLFGAVILPNRRIGKAGDVQSPDRLMKRWIRSWRWLNEGLALAAETKVYPAIQDWLHYTLDWMDRPERSLDDAEPGAAYQAVMLVRCLNREMERRSDPDFFVRVWQRARCVWDPEKDATGCGKRLTAVTAIMVELRVRHGIEFCSADPSVADFFATRYCFDSYFLLDEPEAAAWSKEGRAVSEVWRLGPGEVADDTDFDYPLSGLACRYFCFVPQGKARNLGVRVRAGAGHSLKAELALVARDETGRLSLVGKRATATVASDGTLSLEHKNFTVKRCDHAVLVVSNCNFGELPDREASPLDHGSPPAAYAVTTTFRVEAEVT